MNPFKRSVAAALSALLPFAVSGEAIAQVRVMTAPQAAIVTGESLSGLQALPAVDSLPLSAAPELGAAASSLSGLDTLRPAALPAASEALRASRAVQAARAVPANRTASMARSLGASQAARSSERGLTAPRGLADLSNSLSTMFDRTSALPALNAASEQAPLPSPRRRVGLRAKLGAAAVVLMASPALAQAAEAGQQASGGFMDTGWSLGAIIGLGVAGIVTVASLIGAFKSIPQGEVGIVTMFGKYRRVMRPGLNFKVPFVEKVADTLSTQLFSKDLEFQGITQDQANVHFTATVVYHMLGEDKATDETIQKVAYKFRSSAEFERALKSSIEGTVRSLVAGKKQAEILGLRDEIVLHVQEKLEKELESYGYHLKNIQINNIAFDEHIMGAMAKVVAAKNEKEAATYEGEAAMIRATKSAEARGNAIKIEAEAERDAAKARGEGIAHFRKAAAEGLKDAVDSMKDAGKDQSVMIIALSMLLDAYRDMVKEGKGNTFFLDGSPQGLETTMRRMMAISQGDAVKGASSEPEKKDSK